MHDKSVTNRGATSSQKKTGSGLGRPFATVRFGSASVPIYVGKVKGATRYTASFYLNGRRVRRTFSALEKAKQEARLIAQKLLGISFFIPSAPFPPKARGRRGFDGLKKEITSTTGRLAE